VSDKIEFSLTGVDELLGRLNGLKQEVRKRSGRSALRKAANLIRSEAASRAEALNDPKSSPKISDNIAVRFSNGRFKRTGDLMFRVGVLGGAGGGGAGAFDGLPGKDTRHWRMLEFGTEHMAAKPFMRPALENNIGPATNIFIVELDKGISRAIKRQAKKAGK